MALTNVFYSPSGAGSQDGSSAANAKAALTGTSWTTDIEGEARQNTRWIFLAGTYTCTEELIPTSTNPDADNPHFWVGADADGNLLDPKWSDDSQAHLDTTDYPKIIRTNNGGLYQSAGTSTIYRCLHFENTSSSFNQGGVLNSTFGESIRQLYVGVFMRAPENSLASNNNSRVHNNFGAKSIMCEFVHLGTRLDCIVQNGGTNQGSLYNCRIYGASTGGRGNGNGVKCDTNTPQIINCVIDNVKGDGISDQGTSENKNGNFTNNTITRCGANGIDSAGAAQTQGGVQIENNIIFDVGGHAVVANANDDDRLLGSQIAIGDATSGNFSNLDEYENLFTVTAVATTDFVDYANQDYRIRRDSALYKKTEAGNLNLGAIQNEDFEFVSVS
tara:strand:- start:3567 stop:4730 length:1164 start_codon:yes stop_codon:yes gene_type:complete